MAKTSNVFAHIDPVIKARAEAVLEQLGIPMSNAISMFLRQVILQQGLPFEVKLTQGRPTAYGSLTPEQFDCEIKKGLSDIAEGKVYSAESIETEMREDFHLG